MIRCKSCGGMLNHVVTDLTGDCYYECQTGLTGFRRDGERKNSIYTCGKTYDSRGIEFKGVIGYMSGGALQTVRLPRQ